jgi:outer membrane murein-binding lipoprotein Lpp
MKKFFVLSVVMFSFLVTGCSVEIDTGSSKITSQSTELEAKSKAIQDHFNEAMDMATELEGKNTLTTNDQKRLANKIEDVLSVITEFKDVKTPIIGKKIKSIAGKNLKNREEILTKIQEKAEEGKATKEDVHKMKKALSDDLNFKLFN